MKLPKYCLPKVRNKSNRKTRQITGTWLSCCFHSLWFSFCWVKKKQKENSRIKSFCQEASLKSAALLSSHFLSVSAFYSSSFFFSLPHARRTCILSAQTRSRYLLPSRSGIRTARTAFISQTLLGYILRFPWRTCGPAGDPPATYWSTSTRWALVGVTASIIIPYAFIFIFIHP